MKNGMTSQPKGRIAVSLPEEIAETDALLGY
jgi:hypothetical protein